MSAASAVTSSSDTSSEMRIPPLYGKPVLRVVRSPSVHHFDRPVISADGEAHVIDRIARLDLFQQARGVVQQGCGTVEVVVHPDEESTRCHGVPAGG